jgi:hypothetical protein
MVENDSAAEGIAGLVRKRFDAFISHASEDKADIVRPLAERLARYGANIWYDEFALRLGDSLVAKIDEGLANSAFGVIIISPAFLGKKWPDYERHGLTARDVRAGGGILIPVWHNVTVDQVAEFSPTLAQRFAVSTGDMSLNEIALRVLQVIRPDLAEGPMRVAAFERLVASLGRQETVPITQLSTDSSFGPIVEQLPPSLEIRIRLVHNAVREVLDDQFEDWVEDFKRELNPEREVEVWESIAGLYLQVISEYAINDREARAELLSLLLVGSTGSLDSNKIAVGHLPQDMVEAIVAGYRVLKERSPPSP